MGDSVREGSSPQGTSGEFRRREALASGVEFMEKAWSSPPADKAGSKYGLCKHGPGSANLSICVGS